VKLAHIADPHLGIRQYHRQTPAGINQREADVAHAFRAAIDGVIAARPDAVVVAGDLFHSVRPTNAAIVFAFLQFQRLREALPDAPVVLIAGNHDTPRSVETGSILRLFEELGVDVAADEPRRLLYPALDLSVLAVPTRRSPSATAALRPEGEARYRVLLLHGEVEGLPGEHAAADYGGAGQAPRARAEAWTYVALGHYRAAPGGAPRLAPGRSVREPQSLGRAGRRADQRLAGRAGSGRPRPRVGTAMPVPLAGILDLEPVRAEGLLRRHRRADRGAGRAVRGRIADKVVSSGSTTFPAHRSGADHAAIRAYKAEALHFQLDLRRRRSPAPSASVRQAAGRRSRDRPRLPRGRPLPAELDRRAFVRLGEELMDAVERELAGG
jgi:hypothetical protein